MHFMLALPEASWHPDHKVGKTTPVAIEAMVETTVDHLVAVSLLHITIHHNEQIDMSHDHITDGRLRRGVDKEVTAELVIMLKEAAGEELTEV